MQINPPIERIARLVLFLYPIVLLTVKGGIGWCFFILFFISVYILKKNRTPLSFSTYSWFAFAMSSCLVATILSQAYHTNFIFRYWDSPLRFLLAIPIYLALRTLGLRVMAVLEVGFPLGAILGLMVALITQYSQLGSPGFRLGTYFMNPIHFGNLALLLGVLSLCTINWIRRDNQYLLAIKISGLLAGVVGSMMSGARGGWIAIPFMLLAWVIFQPQTNKTKLILRSIPIVLAIFVSSYWLLDVVRLRVDGSLAEVNAILSGNLATSFGLRVQLWQAAVLMFKENPLFGVGPDAFFQTMTQLQQGGSLSHIAAETYGTEVHSYYFAAMAELGIFGLISALAVFVVPLVLFYRATKVGNEFKRGAALMGACTVMSFFVFCFTLEMFNLKMIASFYALTIAVLMAAAHHQAESPAPLQRVDPIINRTPLSN